jgi:hypothetical protein
MIKTFKNFDEELRSQKVYEANDYDYDNEDVLIDDSIIPDLISDDKILLQISNIILKSLNDPKNDLGKFTIKPTVIQLNNTPSAYFYNKDKSINIVACRKNSIKYVYLFKKFDLGSSNIADLVLSTNTTGFKEIIDRLISRLSSFNNENINEARVSTNKWQEQYGTYAPYTDKDVLCFIELSTESRKSIFKIIIDEISRNPKKPVNSSSKRIPDDVLDELREIYNKKGIAFSASTIRIKIASAFYNAYSGETKHADDMSKLFLNTDYEPGKTIVTKEEITEEEDVTTYSKATAFFDEKEYIEGFKEFKKTMQDIFDTTCSFCNYVKNNGEISKKDIKQTKGKRCMVITGRPGTGKSEYVYQALTKMQMRPDKDYHVFTSANTAAESLYKAFYNYNGKLLIFDDTADLFNSQYKGSLWQNAFQKTVHRSVIASPKKSTDDDSKKSLKTYPTADVSRQERYFLEVGNKSNAIKRDFIEKEKEKITARYKDEHGIDDIEIKLSDKDKRSIDRLVEKSWSEYSSKIKPAMPDSFSYGGVVIIITNKKRAVLASDKIMGEIWKSIESRAKNFSVDPGNQEIWLAIKEKIIQQTEDFNDGKIKDPEICMIPPGVADKFIEFVEHTFATETKYQFMTFRTVAEDIHSLFADGWEDEDNPDWWHYEVKQCMKNRDYDN